MDGNADALEEAMSLPLESRSKDRHSRKHRSRRRAGVLLLLFGVFHLCLCGLLAWETVRPKRRRMVTTPLTSGMAFENIAFPSQNDLTLRGWLIPAAHKPHGLILCCHGVDSDRSDLLATAAILHMADYTVLLFDFRARGESDGSRSTLGYREVDDLLAAIRYARSRRELTEVPLGLLGESMGGAVVLMGAARCADVRGVIAESPFARLDHAVNNHFRSVLGAAAPLLSVPTRWIGQLFIGRSCTDIAPIQEIAPIAPRPLLLIEDGSDTLCPPEETQALFHAAGYPKSLWNVPGATHINAQNTAAAEYAHRITQFFHDALPNQALSNQALHARK